MEETNLGSAACGGKPCGGKKGRRPLLGPQEPAFYVGHCRSPGARARLEMLRRQGVLTLGLALFHSSIPRRLPKSCCGAGTGDPGSSSARAFPHCFLKGGRVEGTCRNFPKGRLRSESQNSLVPTRCSSHLSLCVSLRLCTLAIHPHPDLG